MIKSIYVAVLGAGMSGLTFAAQVSKMPHVNCTVFDRDVRIGGRVYSHKVTNHLYADMGANIIDF